MTKEKLATILSGREYGDEITSDEEELAKASGLVVIFGASDDLIEFRGAIDREEDCYGQSIFVLAQDGMRFPDFNEFCRTADFHNEKAVEKYFEIKKQNKATIKVKWNEDGLSEYAWEISADIPYSEFDIWEDGKKYSKGIIFSIEDIKTKGGTKGMRNWQNETIVKQLIPDADWTGGRSGVVLSLGERVKGVLKGATYGSLFAYLWRRFGAPICGSDPHKDLVAYYLTTNDPAVGFSFSCTPSFEDGGAIFYMITRDLFEEYLKSDRRKNDEYIDDQQKIIRPLQEMKDSIQKRVLTAIEFGVRDLLRPVFIRDQAINAIGEMPDEDYDETKVERSPLAGKGFPVHLMMHDDWFALVHQIKIIGVKNALQIIEQNNALTTKTEQNNNG